MDILLNMQKKYLNFSKSEKKIADYILSHSNQINNMNINELSQKTQTSNATITRFVKKNGCKTYADMKLSISQSLIPNETISQDEIIDEVFLFYQKVIKKTQRFIKPEKFQKFYQLLKQKKHIIVIGASSSGETAKTFSLRLTRMGLDSQSYSDPLWMVMRANIASKDDLFLAISNSGITDCIVSTIKAAKKQGSTIASITSYHDNPVSQLSDLTFYVYNTRFVNNEKFINSQFSNMYLIDVLTTYLQKDDIFKNTMIKTRKAINDI
ncbi:MurR/RpiR family transcriptional regulator [Bombilactobacillus bombi]|uniref:MurR/RpiR family transcriptional regulator n=1 Tax=Bombilactobacillus bombi TaxID=1303590 RepID=UPI000E5933D7|nr:MurR/RpiR family transcriptional regulator [Bombilactobacillus bombi]AXX65228.1 MurR/RpiR family transcriptional regulator [Bombilactobacillus bombi]